MIWPGSFIELSLASDIAPDSTLTVEPRSDFAKASQTWPSPQITEAVSDKIQIYNDSEEPQLVNKHDHLCQVRCTTTTDCSIPNLIPHSQTSSEPVKIEPYTSTVSVDPDNILQDSSQVEFCNLLREYDDVFSPQITGYNGAVGKFEAIVNMGPVLPPQR